MGNVLNPCRAQTSQPSSPQTIKTSRSSASLPAPGCKNQTAACSMQGALKCLSEDSRSLQLTLSPVIHASPLLAAHQELDGALPSCARLAGREAETLQPLSSQRLLHHLRPGQASQGLAHTGARAGSQRQRGAVFPKGITAPAARGGPQHSCVVGHRHSCGTAQADTEPGSLPHE